MQGYTSHEHLSRARILMLCQTAGHPGPWYLAAAPVLPPVAAQGPLPKVFSKVSGLVPLQCHRHTSGCSAIVLLLSDCLTVAAMHGVIESTPAPLIPH